MISIRTSITHPFSPRDKVKTAMRIASLLSVLTLTLSYLAPSAYALTQDVANQMSDLFTNNGTGHTHTNNWAVLVCTSRYWFNYRHMANTLAMYRTIKRLGIPDSNIIMMLADDVACNSRNAFPATVYANKGKQMDLYGDAVEVDYRGYEVTVESFLRLLTGRQPAHTPSHKRLLTDSSSNVFLYMTGHGGNEFLKFQDNEEISAFDLADAVEQMSEKRRFNKLLFVIDTCQANTMYSKFYSPNLISTGSSGLGESSYSHHNDMDIGVSVIDAYTHYILQYLETLNKTSKATMQDLFDVYNPVLINSHPGISHELSKAKPDEILVTDFFGGVANVEVTPVENTLSPFGRNPIKWEASAPKKHKNTIGDSKAFLKKTAQQPHVTKPRGWQSPLHTSASSVIDYAKGGLTVIAVSLVAALLWRSNANPREGLKED